MSQDGDTQSRRLEFVSGNVFVVMPFEIEEEEEEEAALTTATAVETIFETILLSNFSKTVVEEPFVGEPPTPLNIIDCGRGSKLRGRELDFERLC